MGDASKAVKFDPIRKQTNTNLRFHFEIYSISLLLVCVCVGGKKGTQEADDQSRWMKRDR